MWNEIMDEYQRIEVGDDGDAAEDPGGEVGDCGAESGTPAMRRRFTVLVRRHGWDPTDVKTAFVLSGCSVANDW